MPTRQGDVNTNSTANIYTLYVTLNYVVHTALTDVGLGYRYVPDLLNRMLAPIADSSALEHPQEILVYLQGPNPAFQPR